MSGGAAAAAENDTMQPGNTTDAHSSRDQQMSMNAIFACPGEQSQATVPFVRGSPLSQLLMSRIRGSHCSPCIRGFTQRNTVRKKANQSVRVTLRTGDGECPPQPIANDEEVAESRLRQAQHAIATGYRGNALTYPP